MKSPILSQKGFTLVELLVALTIFAVGMLAVAGMQITSIRANLKSNIRSTAIAAGQGVLEELTARADSDPIFALPGPNTGTVVVAVDDGDTTISYNINYTVTHDTVTQDLIPINNLARIDAQVVSSWDGLLRYNLTSFKGTQ
jgi:type IV pilus assembly protein PilV